MEREDRKRIKREQQECRERINLENKLNTLEQRRERKRKDKHLRNALCILLLFAYISFSSDVGKFIIELLGDNLLAWFVSMGAGLAVAAAFLIIAMLVQGREL